MLQVGDAIPGDPNAGNSFGLHYPYVYGAIPGDPSPGSAVWHRNTGVIASVFEVNPAIYIDARKADWMAFNETQILNQPYAHLASYRAPRLPITSPGRMAIIIDGQFGSTGKGLISSWIGAMEKVDIAVSNAAPNAGHSFFVPGNPEKQVLRLLPVSAIFNPDSLIYLCAGAVIDADLLLQEMKRFKIDPARVKIHPRAAIVEGIDLAIENDALSSVAKIASTQKGVGSAIARKVMRSSGLAASSPKLSTMVSELDLHDRLEAGATVLMEVPQGLGLGLNSGLSYPHVTSREISVPAAMADAQVHPRYLGSVMMSLRTHPIRVGDLQTDAGRYSSGPFYPDSQELEWDELGVEAETTTVTKRIRRVATFSFDQYRQAINSIRPTHVFMNFMNYIKGEDAKVVFLQECARIKPVTHIADGPAIDDVIEL